MKTLIILISALFVYNVQSQTIYWTGAVSSDWNDIANWSGPYVSGVDVVIDPVNFSGPPPGQVGSLFVPNRISVLNGAILEVENLMATGQIEVSGDGSQLIVNGSLIQNAVIPGTGIRFSDGAHFEMISGTVGSGYQMEFLSGSTGVMNAGNFTVYQDLIIDGGNSDHSSAFTQHGGAMLVSRHICLKSVTANYTPVFEKDAGNLTIDGNLLWTGGVSDSGQGRFIVSGGTVHLQGNLQQTLPATMQIYMELSGATAAFQKMDGTVKTLLAEDSLMILNGAEWYDFGNVSWQNNGYFWANASSFFVSGNSTFSGNGTYQFEHLWAFPLGTITAATTESIHISGNFSVLGSAQFLPGNGKIVLNGTHHQNITADTALTFYDLEVNNSASGSADGGYGVSLNNSIVVTHSLLFADGIMDADPAFTVTINDNADVSVSGNLTFLQGTMIKMGDDAVLFPLGEAPGRYRPFGITAPANTGTIVSVRYVSESYTSLIPVEGPLQSVSADEYWDVQRIGSNDLFAVNAGWNDPIAENMSDCEDIDLSVWNGAEWMHVTAAPAGACSVNGAGALSSGELPWIGPVTIGFLTSFQQQQVNLCAGESYTIGSHVYNETGIYLDTFQNVYGNDSIIRTELMVSSNLDLAVANNITSLVSQQMTGAHQWIDCETGDQISGATGAYFSPTENGSYAVILGQGTCADTSACFMIDQLDLHETQMAGDVLLSPNPVNDILSITAPDLWPEDVKLYTLKGASISVPIVSDAVGVKVDLSSEPPGIYLISAVVKGGLLTWRIVKL